MNVNTPSTPSDGSSEPLGGVFVGSTPANPTGEKKGARTDFRDSKQLVLGIVSILAGIVGWFASFKLLNEYIKTLKVDGYVPGCNISVLVSCSPNLESWQGAIFGFSNTFIGLGAFVVPILMGVAFLAGIKFPKWWLNLYNVGLALGFIFILWLAYQSIFSLHTLCPWCMVVWTVMTPLFWLTVSETNISAEGKLAAVWQSIHQFRWVLILITFLTIAVTAQLRLNWLDELL